jgi:hypothetical protein
MVIFVDKFSKAGDKDKGRGRGRSRSDHRQQLVGELGFFEEVLDLFWVIKVTFQADVFHLMDLTSTSGSLDVLKVNFRVLAKVDNQAKVILEPYADSWAA